MSNKAYDKIHEKYSKITLDTRNNSDNTTFLKSVKKTWDHTTIATNCVDESLYYYLRDFMRDLK